MTKKNSPAQKLRKIRFAPDPGTLAEMNFDKDLQVYGLVLNESSGGFAVVVMTDKKIPVGAICQARVGNLSWAPAEVRWSKKLDTNLFKLGLEYDL